MFSLGWFIRVSLILNAKKKKGERMSKAAVKNKYLGSSRVVERHKDPTLLKHKVFAKFLD